MTTESPPVVDPLKTPTEVTVGTAAYTFGATETRIPSERMMAGANKRSVRPADCKALLLMALFVVLCHTLYASLHCLVFRVFLEPCSICRQR